MATSNAVFVAAVAKRREFRFGYVDPRFGKRGYVEQGAVHLTNAEIRGGMGLCDLSLSAKVR